MLSDLLVLCEKIFTFTADSLVVVLPFWRGHRPAEVLHVVTRVRTDSGESGVETSTGANPRFPFALRDHQHEAAAGGE